MSADAGSTERNDPTYDYKPSPLGAPWTFRLAPDAIEWRVGRYEGRTPYAHITRIRLSFRPVAMQTRRFVAEIWSQGGPRLTIASGSWRSMFDLENRGEAYGAFMRALHRRLADAQVPTEYASTEFVTGTSPFRYWPGLVVFVVVALGLAAFTLQAMLTGVWPAAVFIGGFLVLFLWQSGVYFRRNVPGTYRPDSPPGWLLP